MKIIFVIYSNLELVLRQKSTEILWIRIKVCLLKRIAVTGELKARNQLFLVPS